MYIPDKELIWNDEKLAPTMNYKIFITKGGLYHVWILVKFDDDKSDACLIGIDGKIQNGNDQFCGGSFFTYSMKQRWNWQLLSDIDLNKGEHLFSIIAKKSGLRIARIFLTFEDKMPPEDKKWGIAQI